MDLPWSVLLTCLIGFAAGYVMAGLLRRPEPPIEVLTPRHEVEVAAAAERLARANAELLKATQGAPPIVVIGLIVTLAVLVELQRQQTDAIERPRRR